jgi:hypothetical protein
MSMKPCTKHDNAVVVYDADYVRRHAIYPLCPLCQMIEKCDNLDARVGDLESERDGLQVEAKDLVAQVRELEKNGVE